MTTNDVSHSGRRVPVGSAYRALLILGSFWIAAQMQWLALRIPGYRELYQRHPFYVPEGIRSVVTIAFVVIVVMAMDPRSPSGASRQLGIARAPWPGLVFAAVATLPMWAIFAVTMPPSRAPDPWSVAYLAGLSPLAEEVVFRGFAFGQLRRLGWGFWSAVLVPSGVFGFAHLRQGQGPGEMVGVFLITAAGGLLFAYVYERWDRSLWAPFGLHASMNLAWQLFDVGRSAAAGWLPTVAQAVVAVAAVVLTLGRNRLPPPFRSAADGPVE